MHKTRPNTTALHSSNRFCLELHENATEPRRTTLAVLDINSSRQPDISTSTRQSCCRKLQLTVSASDAKKTHQNCAGTRIFHVKRQAATRHDTASSLKETVRTMKTPTTLRARKNQPRSASPCEQHLDILFSSLTAHYVPQCTTRNYSSYHNI